MEYVEFAARRRYGGRREWKTADKVVSFVCGALAAVGSLALSLVAWFGVAIGGCGGWENTEVPADGSAREAVCQSLNALDSLAWPNLWAPALVIAVATAITINRESAGPLLLGVLIAFLLAVVPAIVIFHLPG